MMKGVHGKLNPGFLWEKQLSTIKKTFHQQIGLNFMEETGKVLHLEYSFIGSLRLIMWEKKKCCIESRRGIFYKLKRRQATWIGHILH